jgi:glycosyltransferase involved in cell wall biosynthesis
LRDLRILLVGHLPVHLGSLEKGLREFCDLELVHWAPIRFFSKGTSVFVVPLLIVRILFRSIRGTDLILAQYAFPDGFSSVVASKLTGVPSVIQVIGSDILIAARGLKRNLVGWTVSRASGVICVSSELENCVRGMGAKNTIIVPSPLDLSDMPKSGHIKRPDRSLITVASLTKIKGLDVLLRALQSLTDFQLLIVGDGPERPSLERLVENLRLQDKVRFLGQVPHERLWEHLLSSSVFILPSLSEGLPRALLEAMACGLFIVASRVGGIPEAVRNGWNGILVPPNDPEALREGIERALADRKWAETVGERNRLEAQRFALGRVAERQFQFLSSIVVQTRRTEGQ